MLLKFNQSDTFDPCAVGRNLWDIMLDFTNSKSRQLNFQLPITR